MDDLNKLPMTFACPLCECRLKYTSPRAFSAVMRRHRARQHPDHQGSIKYLRVLEGKKS